MTAPDLDRGSLQRHAPLFLDYLIVRGLLLLASLIVAALRLAHRLGSPLRVARHPLRLSSALSRQSMRTFRRSRGPTAVSRVAVREIVRGDVG